MEVKVQTTLEILKESTKDTFRGPTECYGRLAMLNDHLVNEQLNASVIDSYVLHIFDRSHGLFNFLSEVASNSKFDNATVTALEIIYTLINNFPKTVDQYILDINKHCLKLLQTKTTAKVKTKCLDVLLISLEKIDKCLENQKNYTEIYDGVRACLLQGLHSDSVRMKEFIAVGLFAKRFSYLVIDPKSVKSYFITQLDNQMIKGLVQSIVHGIFTGWAYFCESFPLNLDNHEDVAIVDKLYKYIKQLSTIDCSQRFGNRAAISFFGSNMNVFIKLAINEYKQWHKRLLVDWLKSGFDDKKVGEQTLNALLLAVADCLVVMDKNDCMPILTHFINWFKSILKNGNASFTEKKLCVQGLKYFSHALYKHYSKDEARRVFVLVMQIFEESYILTQTVEKDVSEFLPDFVQCLASFMRYQTFTTSEIHCLQKAVINMTKTFNNLKPLHHYSVIFALVNTLFYLKDTKYFDSFLENIVYQGVVWSCSHKHITDSDFTNERNKIFTVKDYFPLWRGLLRMASDRSYEKVAIYFNHRSYILTRLVNELVKTLMILINKLNVNVQLKEDVVQTDLEWAYRVEHSYDYAIFLNVTDFYQEIFENVAPELLKPCICKIIGHLLEKSAKYPLVSGFYKLLSFALKISNQLKLFDRDNITLNQDVINCKESLSKFLIILLHKMKQFKDELLIACLFVLLESPVVIVEPLLPECTGVFITIFEVGRSYIALADMGLSTLKRWQSSMDQTEFETFLLQVIPVLDSYLRSKSLGIMSVSNMAEKKRKTAQGLKKRTVLVELQSELVKFQKEVLHFVGSQNAKICEAFVSPDNNFERKVTSDNLHLKVTLPYNDLALDIHLEPFIMRVVELSLYSSDRKTRVMACELLQAIVMVFLGKTKQMSSSSLSDLDDLLKNIAMPLLQLACDMDKVVRQIFEPLFLQLVHWYTSKVQKASPHLAVIIEVLMEGVTHPTNSSLRDFSGKCINELLKWTIKHHSESELKHNPINIKVLVKRMCFFSGHPDLIKKLGAALIFNNIYLEFREERSLISIFSIELLHIFMGSLALLDHPNEENEPVAVQINNVIAHLQRIFIEKAEIFRECDDLRRVPSDIPEGNLNGLCQWLLTMTSNRSKYCRDVALQLLIHLQPLCGVKESLIVFVQRHVNNISRLFIGPMVNYSTLEDFNGSETSMTLLKWLRALLCLIDGYLFIVKFSLCTVDVNDMKPIMYFLKHIHDADIEHSLKLIYKSASVPFYTTSNKQQFNTLKSSCNSAILQLVIALLNKEPSLTQFYTHDLWRFIVNCIFNPTALEINEGTDKVKVKDNLGIFLNSVSRKLKSEFLEELMDIIREYVSKQLIVDVDLKRNVGKRQRDILKGLILIQSSRLNDVFKAESFAVGLIDHLLSNFLKNAEGNIFYDNQLSETATEYCRLIFTFALTNSAELATLLTYLYKPIFVADSEVTFGMYLFSKYDDPLAKTIATHFEEFLEGSDCVERMVQFTSSFLNYLETNGRPFALCFREICDALMTKWDLFEIYFEENNVDFGLDFVLQMWRLFGVFLDNNENVQNWLLSLISRDKILLTQLDGVDLYLNILKVLVTTSEDQDHMEIKCALDKLQSIFKPALLADPENNKLLEKLLILFPLVKNQMILSFMLDLYEDFGLKQHKKNMNLNALLKCFMASNCMDKFQYATLVNVYRRAIDKNKTFEQKKFMVGTVLVHIFKNSKLSVFVRFFEEHIKSILDRLTEDYCDFGNGLVDFLLIELLFYRVPMDLSESKIVVNSGEPKLRNRLLKIALDTFRRNSKSDENKEHLRLLKCSAYTALASIICNSDQMDAFYEKLFVREENGEDILWSSLIDTSRNYQFPMDFDSYPKQRKIVVNIRNSLRKDSVPKSYIESQRLFNSSLSEDVTKFDFTNSVLRSGANTTNKDGQLEENECDYREEEVVLEETDINDQEVMAPVCDIINNMFTKGICQLPEEGEMAEDCPRWMQAIGNLLLNPNTSKNVKIFWMNVIDIQAHIFRRFASFFIKPVLKFLNDKVAGSDLNYFVCDKIVLVAVWSESHSPDQEESLMASQFLEHIISSMDNEKHQAFKYSLDLLKLIVEHWRNYLRVPYKSLVEKLNYPVTDRSIEVGLHLISVFLVNNIAPFLEEDVNTFWNKLMEILGSSVSTIYKPCAETLGLMLNFRMKQGIGQPSLPLALNKKLLSFNDINKYSYCLEVIAIHYPDIVDSYHIIKMLNRLSQSTQNVQTIFLKIIYKRVDILAEIDSFKTEDWCKYLESQNAELQLIALEIILKTFPILIAQNSFKAILKSVYKNLLNPNIFCRGRMYDIYMAILEYGQIKDEEILGMCKEVLVQGLTDTDTETKEKVRTFWSENSQIPSSVSSKFPYLMSNFYLAKTEEHFLGYVSYFLLDDIIGDEYEKVLFEHPLEDCDFEEYKLETNWRLQHPSVVPMFAETLRTYSDETNYSASTNFEGVRATKDNLTFAPTQRTVREQHISQITGLESSLLAASVDEMSSNRRTFVDPNAVHLSEKYRLPKKRFLKDKGKISAGFAHKAVAERIKKVAQRNDAVKEQEKKVTIFRSYRKGDFPDIQITLGCLIKPLKMLVLHDGEISKTFFSVVYKVLQEKVKNFQTDFTAEVLKSINRVFTTSVQYNANVFSTLLDILLRSQKEFRVDPGLISSVCQQSGLISTGTLLIEEYLTHIEHVSSGAKRGVGAQNEETRHWLKLAELYKELHEWNLVRTIFLEKTNCKEEVQKAIVLESDKRWRDAQETYQKLLQNDLSVERQDFYYESYFKCLAHLGEWDKLPKTVESLVPEGGEKTWDSLWDNDWFQQKILPWYVGAKIKNILFTKEHDAQFLSDINKSLCNPKQEAYLKSKFSEELCILWLTQRDCAQAEQYLKLSLDNFLGEWQLLNPMFGRRRYNKILSLRTLIETDVFLIVEKQLTETATEEKLNALQNYWKLTQKEYLPTILLSEARLLYRKLFGRLLIDKLTKLNQVEQAKAIKTTNILLDISFMNLAVEEENYYMTRKYYRFPTDMNTRGIWLSLVGPEENKGIQKRMLCSDHFEPNDILQKTNVSKYLKPGAMPKLVHSLFQASSFSSDSSIFDSPIRKPEEGDGSMLHTLRKNLFMEDRVNDNLGPPIQLKDLDATLVASPQSVNIVGGPSHPPSIGGPSALSEYVDLKHQSLTMIFGNLTRLYAALVKNNPSLKLEKLLEALNKFREVAPLNDEEKAIGSLLHVFDVSREITDVLSNNPELYGKHQSDIREIFGSEGMAPLEIAYESLKGEILKNSCPLSGGRQKNNVTKEKTKAFIKLAYFVQNQPDKEEQFVLFVLRAMKLGSQEARQLFPCILLKNSSAHQLRDIFIEETKDIPTWMFLGWIPQLLANVDSPKVIAISEIILRIARTYPQAIMYSYRLSKENYSDGDSLELEETRCLTRTLDELLLNDPMVDTFLTALSKVSVPLATLEYYIKKMFSAPDIESVTKIREDLLEFFFKDTSDSKTADNMQGNMYKTVRNLRKDFQTINTGLSVDKVKQLLKTLNDKRQQLLEQRKSDLLLKDYCPWLANFSAGRLNLELEIPGQYTGNKLPLVQHHVKISGFCETVSVMSSLRRPIKVTMLGMDSKEYPFLIKFGEDIRQDERIQQLFMLMNNIFASDNQHNHVLTYQVIPLTSSLGIIQWVEHTVSLEDFIKRSLPVKTRDKIFESLFTKYNQFFPKQGNNLDRYGLTAIGKDRNKVIPFYKGLVNEIPLDILRSSIWSLSLTTESFIAFKDNFVKSYAAICACQWILGIGDRHLQNSKVCLRNGKVLGIDFGHAFGTATQILSVPELVPIRLTPHIIALMEPLREKGVFRHVLIECLKSMRKNSGPLLATMNVFIQEPSVDWLENARKFQQNESTDTHEWYPLQKVDQAERKLRGASPTTILVEDLKSSSFHVTRYFKTYISLVEGDPNYDLRARLHNKVLSVEEQVDVLIDHATDPNLLGRMFAGWKPTV